ncbi:MAG TPA: hypothetical protein VKV69_14580 [Actinomycetota bacterium]|nr:hypothetical protein [Actinomycetota bacterium]
MTEAKRSVRKPRRPGRIPAMGEQHPADGDLASTAATPYRPATRVVPRDRRLEQKSERRVAA